MAFLARAGAALALLASAIACAQAPKLPIESFFAPPMFQDAALSPDQSQVAVLVNRPGERTQLALLNLDNAGSTKLAAAVHRMDIVSATWLSPKRLVFQAGQAHELRDTPIATGLWVLDVPSGDVTALIDDRYNEKAGEAQLGTRIKTSADKILPWTWRVRRVLQDGSEDVMVERTEWDATGQFSHVVLGRLNTRNGKVTLATENAPARVWGWSVDAKGRPEAAVSIDGPNFGVHLYDNDAGTWRLWRTGKRNIDAMPTPLARLPGGDLLTADYDDKASGGNFRIVQRQNTGEAGGAQTLLSLPGYDWRGTTITDPNTGRLLGLTYESEVAETAWFDKDMKALQAEIDKQLPNTVNRIDCLDCLKERRLLVLARSDRQPEITYLFDRSDRSLRPLLRSRPDVRAADMAPREVLRYKARDGLEVPVQVTRPLGTAGPRPTVVLVHGGPRVRGNHWFWERQAQFLANRGYLVVEPEFRGSMGYGSRHENLGRRQWGQAMQADLADAAKWAVAQGMADPKRICIAGASYGGYATLMGLVRDPELFACGVEWVGVTDPINMFKRSTTDIASVYQEYDLRLTIGDPEKDAQMFAENSPVRQADKLKQPLLMAYGAEDRRVAVQQGIEMKKALEAAGYQGLEWVVYPNEGHGWRSLETNKDFWGRVERFLARHIGDAPARP